MINFLIDIIKKKIRTGLFLGATSYELDNFFCGIGESEIRENSISITSYSFEPSSVFPDKEITYQQIAEVYLNSTPPTIKVGEELIFISKEYIDELTEFASRNQIETTERNSNWDQISEPFLDTEFSDEYKAQTMAYLKENGFTKDEIIELRKEISKQMYKYNFDTMLWDWHHLGLNDVLSAMRVKLNLEEFKEFYWRAMKIEQRGK